MLALPIFKEDRGMKSSSLVLVLLLLVAGPGRAPAPPPAPAAWASVAAFSPDGKFVLVGYEDTGPEAYTGKAPLLRVWEVASGTEVRAFTGHNRQVDYVAWLHDGKHVLSHSGDETFRLWDVATGRQLRSWDRPKDGAIVGGLSPNGKLLLTWGYKGDWNPHEGQFKLWEVATGKLLRTFDGKNLLPCSIGFSPDSKFALLACSSYIAGQLGGDSGGLRILDVTTGKITPTSNLTKQRCNFLTTFSPDGKCLVLETLEDTPDRPRGTAWVVLWDLGKDKEARRFLRREPGAAAPPDGQVYACHMALATDGQRLLTIDVDRRTRLWDLRKGEALWSAEACGWATTFTADGKHVLLLSGAPTQVGGRVGAVKTGVEFQLRDAETGRLIRTLPGRTGR
jgi:WD40 repeat protein